MSLYRILYIYIYIKYFSIGTNHCRSSACVFWGSVHALVVFHSHTQCHYIIKQTWESASRHFAMQMLHWEKSVRLCDSYSHIHHTSNPTCSLRGLLQTPPRAPCVCALVMSAYLLVCFTLPLICLPQEPRRMTVSAKQHI